MIDSSNKLAEIAPVLNAADWIALDTEADSLHAYPEKLCLLQISVQGQDFLIDPLAGFDLAPLFQILKNHELILHGADYDLRLFRKTYGFVPHAIFDTMIAARLLGYTKVGLTDLVSQDLGVQLEKGPQKMNWARRPLTERMEKYAYNDTHYLQPLAARLRQQLSEKGRLAWHAETCAVLVQDCAQERAGDPDSDWRIRGSDRLRPPALAVLREIWEWREAEAIEANKPPFFVLSHESLVKLAEAVTADQPFDSLLPGSLSARRQERLFAAIERGLKLPASKYPRPRRHVGIRLTVAEQERFEQLRRLRDERGTTLGIDPTLIVNRANLVEIAKSEAAMETRLMRWQQEILRTT